LSDEEETDQTVRPAARSRTCAKLCHDRGGELEQIQFLLGHASVQITERYCAQKGDMCSECPSLLIGKASASVDST